MSKLTGIFKHLFLTLIFGFSAASVHGQISYQRVYGGTSSEQILGISQASPGYLLIGETDSFGNGSKDVLLVRVDQFGGKLWSKTFGTSGSEIGTAACEASNGDFLLTGTSGNSGSGDVLLYRISANGNLLWQIETGGNSNDQGIDLLELPSGDILVLAESSSGGNGQSDFRLIRFNSAGVLQWSRNYGNSGLDIPAAMTLGTDGAVYLAGYRENYSGDPGKEAILAKINTNGALIWTRKYGGSADDYFTGIEAAPDSSLILSGVTSSFGYGNDDIWVSRINENGNITWNSVLGGVQVDRAGDARLTSSGDILVSGYSESYGLQGREFILIKLDNNGNPYWGRTFGSSGTESLELNGRNMVVNADDGATIGGFTNSIGAGGNDFFLIRTTNFGIHIGCMFGMHSPASQNPAFSNNPLSWGNISSGSVMSSGLSMVSPVVDDSLLCCTLPYPDFTDSTPCFVDSVYFTDTSSLVMPGATYYWDFENDSVVDDSVNKNPAVLYPAPGYYQVSLRIKQPCGISNTITKTIYIPDSLHPYLGPDISVCGSDTFVLKDTNQFVTHLWNTGAVSDSLIVSSTGDFWLEITDTNACSYRDSIRIDVNNPAQISLGPDDIICPNDTYTINPTGTPGLITWSTGDTLQQLSLDSAGTYIATVIDSNGCNASDTIILTDSDLQGPSLSGSDILCPGGSTGAVTSSVSGTASPFIYFWTGPGGFTANTQNISNLPAGLYELTVTDSNSCDVSDTITLVELAPPISINSNINHESCTGSSDGSIKVTASGGYGSYTYQWSNGLVGDSISALSPGNYFLTVTDSAGCQGSFTLTVNPAPVVFTGMQTYPVSCNGDSNGMAIVNFAGGYGRFSWWWESGFPNADTTENYAPGTYWIYWADTSGSGQVCLDSANFVIGNPQPLSLSTNVQNISCSGANNGAAFAQGSGGHGNYQYSWSPSGPDSAQWTNLSTGQYFVSLTDTAWTPASPSGYNTCTTTDSVQISVSGFANPQATLTHVACHGDSLGAINLTINGGIAPITYTWTGSPGFQDSTEDITGLPAGTYFFEANDNSGCVSRDTFNIIQPDSALSIQFNQVQESCPAASDGIIRALVRGGSPAYQYSWSNGSNADSLGGIQGGFYQLTVTDSAGCEISDSTSLPALTPYNASIQPYNVTCNGDSNGLAHASFSGGHGNYSWNWSYDNSGGDTVFGLPGGVHQLYFLDTSTAGEQCRDTFNFVISEPSVLSSNISKQDVSCSGASNGSAVVNVSGGNGNYSYLWSNGSNSPSITQLNPGIYSVQIADTAYSPLFNQGFTTCNLIDTVQILVSNFNSPTLTPQHLSCHGDSTGEIQLSLNGGQPPFSFSWTGPASYQSSQQNIQNLKAGKYVVQVTDSIGCVTVDSAEISEPSSILLASTQATNESCPGGSDGSISLSLSGGSAPYTIIWQDGDSSFNRFNLSPGTYIAGITDSLGCTLTDTTEILPLQPYSASIQTFDVSCPGASDGTAVVQFAGGNGNYSRSWSGGFSNADTVFSLPGGIHYVALTDSIANGGVCRDTFSFSISEPSNVTSGLTAVPVSCAGNSDGTVQANPGGGNGNYGFNWLSGPSTATWNNVASGTYIVEISDTSYTSFSSQGFKVCTVYDTISVSSGSSLNINYSASPVSCFGLSDATATAMVNGGTAPYNYIWSSSPQQTGSTADSLSAGLLDLIVTDSTGCRDSIPVMIPGPQKINIQFTKSDLTCFGGQNGSVMAAPSGGTGGFSYFWTNSDTTSGLNNLGAGVYSLTVTDSSGCSFTDSIQLYQPGKISTTVKVLDVSCSGDADGEIHVVNTLGGNAPYTYQLSGGIQNGQIYTGLQASTYSLVTSDTDGCTDTSLISVGQPGPLMLSASVTSNLCQGQQASAKATVNAVGGTPPYNYSWNTNPPQNGPTAVNLANGNYICTVTDANKCQDTIQVNISTLPPPVVIAGPDTSFCDGSGGVPVFANASLGGGSYSYSWWCDTSGTFCGLDSVNDDDPLANPTVTSTYYVQVTDNNGCQSNIDSLTVTVLPLPVTNAGADIYICPDSAPCKVLTGSVSNAPGPYSYRWYPSVGLSNDTVLTPCARPDSTTLYTLQAISSNGCASDITTLDTNSTVRVIVKPAPVADAGPDQEICYGDSLKIQGTASGAGPVYSYEWTPITGINYDTIPNPVVSPSATTVYTLVVRSNGCVGSDSVKIGIRPLPTANAGQDQEICYGDTTLLDGSASGNSPFKFLWGAALTVPDTTSEDIYVSPNQSTSFIFRAVSSFGCVSEADTTNIFVKPSPMAVAGKNIRLCEGDSVQLSGGYFYPGTDSVPDVSRINPVWSPGSAISDSGIWNPWVKPLSASVYYLQVQYTNCVYFDSVVVSVNRRPEAEILADTMVICQYDSLTLGALPGLSGTSYYWSPTTGLSGDQGMQTRASPPDSMQYKLVVDNAGCSDSDSVFINVIPSPDIDIISSDTSGCVPHTVNFMELTENAMSFTWDFGDGSPISNEQNPGHTYRVPGRYRVSLRASNSGKCDAVKNNIFIAVEDTVHPDFSSDIPLPGAVYLDNAKISLRNESENMHAFHWDFGDGNTSEELNPVHTYRDTGTYYISLVATNLAGCVSRLSRGPLLVQMPLLRISNVFSPNGDGVNDIFFTEIESDQPFNLLITDRWGKRVFETKNPANGWDGRLPSGSKAAEGVYFYVLKLGSRAYNGNLTLMR